MSGGEKWLPIIGYEGLYEVSSEGAVRSLGCFVRRGNTGSFSKPGRVLKGSLSRGYVAVALYKDGRAVTVHVHKLVCTAFHGPPYPKTEVAHYDGNKSNNSAANLRWATRSENMADRKRHGILMQGERHTNALLTEDIVRGLRAFVGNHSQAADHFGIGYFHARNIRMRTAWKHVK